MKAKYKIDDNPYQAASSVVKTSVDITSVLHPTYKIITLLSGLTPKSAVTKEHSPHQVGRNMGIQAIVVGAGIAGLSAAIALNKAGHDVVVYERSGFRNEVGAAITVTSNGVRVLKSWGFDPKAAGAVVASRFEMANGKTLETLYNEPFDDVESRFGYPVHFYHRVDLHRELRKLAESLGTQIKLTSPVEDVDAEGAVRIGEQWVSADLVVIADGVYVCV